MNKILTCTDGSIYATSVYDHAAWVAERMEAPIHVLHMLDPHRERAEVVNLSGNLGVDTRQELLNELVNFEETKNRLARERGKAVLAVAREYFAAKGVKSVSYEQLHGALVETVTRMEENASLLVIGKRGESADFAKLHLGSNLERVIRASIRPVLVASRKFKPITRFLIAYDGGTSVRKAIDFILTQPLLKGIPCELVRAGRIDDDAEWFLQEEAQRLRNAGYEVVAEAIDGEPIDVIGKRVQETPIDLLVMGAYGHTRMRQLIVGSTTTTMVRTCGIPVLMFR